MGFWSAFFGEKKPVLFDASQSPRNTEKFSITDAKRLLKLFLQDNKYGDREEISQELDNFSDLISDYKETLKFDLEDLKEELSEEKALLRKTKAELSTFKKSKKIFLDEYADDEKDFGLEQFDNQIADIASTVQNHLTEIDRISKNIEIQKLVGTMNSSVLRATLPIYANSVFDKLNIPFNSEYLPFITPAAIVEFKYRSAKNEITLRTVEVDCFSPFRFSGFCRLRHEHRSFAFASVLEFTTDQPTDDLRSFLLENLSA